ncbi:PD40 domain-containing protein [bacterium]|nr:PD40 domain-containing protein [bacterium]
MGKLVYLLLLLVMPALVLSEGRVAEVKLSPEEAKLRAELRRTPFKMIYETNRDGNWELYVMNPDGSGQVNLTQTSDLDEMYPHASPDGKRICFVQDSWKNTPVGKRKVRSVYFMNIDGSGRTLVCERARQPCWSPDSAKIAFSKAESRRYTTTDFATVGIFIYDIRTKKTTEVPNRNIRHLYNTAWSPDGKWFAATIHKAMGFGHAILAINRGNGRIFPLDAGGCRPDWSPDGKRLTWGVDDFNILVAEFDPSKCRKGAPMPVPLPNKRTVITSKDKSHKVKTYHSDWSPDGNYIAFSYGTGKEQVGETGVWDIYVARSSGGPWLRLTAGAGAKKEPDWIPVAK